MKSYRSFRVVERQQKVFNYWIPYLYLNLVTIYNPKEAHGQTIFLTGWPSFARQKQVAKKSFLAR